MDRTLLLPSLIHGPRLTLRSWVAEDAEALTEAILDSLEHLTPFMAWAATEPLGVEDRRDMLEEWKESWRSGGDSVLGMFTDGIIVGGSGLHRRGGQDTLEIGYWVRTGHTGKGYATEAARLLTAAAFDLDEIEVVAIHHDAANQASRRRDPPHRQGTDGQGEYAHPGAGKLRVPDWSHGQRRPRTS